MNSTTRTQALATGTVADPRWAAVQARDARADGSFFYSVRTTGVYCRPSCGARPPRPENVAFHDKSADAERAGFRACRRCRPDEPSLAVQQAAVVARLCRRLETDEKPPTLDALALDAQWSPFHLHRVFKRITGLTPKAYAAAHRSRRVHDALARSRSVTEAIFDAGYDSVGRFYADAPKVLGMTPTRYRAGGTDTELRFAVGQCSLGAILVARSGIGVCAILLGDDPDALARELQDRFPRAQLLGGDAGFEQWVARVIGFVEAPALGLGLPLDIRGTAFQQRVWTAGAGHARRVPGEPAAWRQPRAVGAAAHARRHLPRRGLSPAARGRSDGGPVRRRPAAGGARPGWPLPIPRLRQRRLERRQQPRPGAFCLRGVVDP